VQPSGDDLTIAKLRRFVVENLPNGMIQEASMHCFVNGKQMAKVNQSLAKGERQAEPPGPAWQRE